MKQMPLEEYIQKLIDYNNNNIVVSTVYGYIRLFNNKFELIKYDTLQMNYTIAYTPRLLFQRYMNNKCWQWEDGIVYDYEWKLK